MSTFTGRFRSNYFRVKDEAAFKEFMSAAGFGENSKYNPFWTSTDEKGRTVYAFGSCTGSVNETIDPFFQIALDHPEFPRFSHEKGYRDLTGFNEANFPYAFLEAHGLEEPETDDTFSNFCLALQSHVADDDAIVIVEAGFEKLRYVGADGTIITKSRIQTLTFGSYVSRCLKGIMGQDYNVRFDG